MTTRIDRSARVGLITDQSGALSFMGIANANVARMVIDDINASGGLLGRPVELFIEDERDRRRGRRGGGREARRAGRRRRGGRRHLQLDPPGHQAPGGRRRGDALPVPRAVRGPGVPPADLLHRSRAGAAGRAVLPVADARDRGADLLHAVGRLHLAAHHEQEGAGGRHAEGGSVVGEEYFPLDHMDYERVVADIMASGADVVFNTIVPPGSRRSSAQLHEAGSPRGGGTIVCTYFDENFLNLVPAEQVEGLYGCLDYYRAVDDPFSIELLNRYDGLFRERDVHGGARAPGRTGRSSSGRRRSPKPGRSTRPRSSRRSTTPGSLPGPGGPAEMVPGSTTCG